MSIFLKVEQGAAEQQKTAGVAGGL